MRLIFIMFLYLSGPAFAEVWTVSLGDRRIGTVTFEAGPNGALTLSSILDSTPLGLADGSFTARSFAALTPEGRRVTQYLSAAESTRKSRNISVLTDAGKPVETRIEPPSEATALSGPGKVQGRVLNPVEAFARIANSTDCPSDLRFYDGRRVVEILTKNSNSSEDAQSCEMDYRVIGGPGHLSPFRFRTVALGLEYRGPGPFTLQEITLSAGGFTAILRR